MREPTTRKRSHFIAVRIGPSGNGMADGNPQVLFDYIADQLNPFGLAYLHIIEPRIKGDVLVAEGQAPIAPEQLRKIFKGKIVAAGGSNQIPPRRLSTRVKLIWSRSGVTSFRIRICRSASS